MALFPNFFGNNNNGQQQQQPMQRSPQQGQQPQGQQQDPNAMQNGGGPAQTVSGNDPNKMPNPVEAYKDIFSPQDPGQEEQAPQFSLKPESIKTAADRLDFMADIPQELQERMQSGEQPSWQDLSVIANHVGRQAYARAMEHQSTLTGTYVDLHSKHSLKGVPKLIKQYLASDKVRQHPSAQSNPVVAQHMQEIAGRLAQRYPNATDEWIAEQTQEYFLNMARTLKPDAFVPSDGERKQRQEKETFDFDAFMTTEERA